MKNIIVLMIGIVAVFPMTTMGKERKVVEVSEALILAIAKVESNNNSFAIGDNGKAVGKFQIWIDVVKDINRIDGQISFTYKDRFCPIKSRAILVRYLWYYGTRYQKITGKVPDDEVLARIWNGGPNGYKRSTTLPYWNKVKTVMSK